MFEKKVGAVYTIIFTYEYNRTDIMKNGSKYPQLLVMGCRKETFTSFVVYPR